MKLLLAFVGGLLLGALALLCFEHRYVVIAGTAESFVKLDRWTGRTWKSVGRIEWLPMEDL